MNTEDTQQHIENAHEAEQPLVLSTNVIEEVQHYEGNKITEKVFALLGAIAVTGLVSTFALSYWRSEPPQVRASQTEQKIVESIPKPPLRDNPFDTVGVSAQAAVVYDVYQKRVIYKKNAHTKLPLASITKLMTTLLAFETLGEDEHIAISPESIAIEGDSGLFANESWDVSELIHFTMLTSSNDGANALAASVGSLWQSTPEIDDESKYIQSFVDRMNFRADELGLDDTRFTNPTGLDDSSPGGLGTAEDTAKLLTYIWEAQPEVLSYTNEQERVFVSLDDFVHVAENTNERVYNIPGLLGGKTGYTDKAGGNLAVIYDAGFDHPITIVVLASTREGRFDDVEKLIDATYGYINSGWYEYETEIGGSTPQS
jgi:D-alanyl-D-alanine carboxypeptidase